jgi:molecular chaperone GrpE
MTEQDRTQSQGNGEAEPASAEADSSKTPSSKAPQSSSKTPQSSSSSKPPPPAEEKPTPESEIAKLRDQLLRTAADFDNFRKRSRREAEDAQKRGRESAIKDLLPVFDNLERAASHAEGAGDAKSLADGLRIVLKQFNDTLDKMGVKRVQTVGAPFDPSVHEAIQHLPSADHPSGVILAEVQSGYSMGDHLIRAAMVVVSKGPPEGSSAAS